MGDEEQRPEHDPFHGMPPELRALLEQLQAGAGGADLGGQLSALFGSGMPTTDGPVDWSLAQRTALQIATDDDRGPSDAERDRAEQAVVLAEHWLDTTSLPAPVDAGRVLVASREAWTRVAIEALKPLIEPVARASTEALVELADEQLAGLADADALDHLGIELPEQLREVFEQLTGGDLGAAVRPAGAMLTGLQVGQVVGQLSRELLGQYELGVPTAPPGTACQLAVNVAETFEGYDLDATEVALVLALHECAHRRLYHAVHWLEDHVRALVAEFAAGIHVDAERLDRLTDELVGHVDPDDPDALRDAMEAAARFRLEPTDEQRRVLERLQGVVCLVGAWARHEAAHAAADRLPSLGRIDEVLRRRRAVRGSGQQLLAGLLGLDLRPPDETVGERFVTEITATLGSDGLHRALAHPENLPDASELADPARWISRTAQDPMLPDDLTALLADLGDAPVEASAAERAHGTPGGEAAGGNGEDPGADDGDDTDGDAGLSR